MLKIKLPKRTSTDGKNGYYSTKEMFEFLGIRIIGEHDYMFYDVELPEGWSVTSKDGFWTDIIDEKGRVRIHYYERSLFYDRDAFNIFSTRFSYELVPFDDYQADVTHEDRILKPWKVYLTDSGKRIRLLKEITASSNEEYVQNMERLKKIARDYLTMNYPNWECSKDYWNGTPEEIVRSVVGKVVNLTEYDAGSGLCEILSANENDCTVQWITYCACYSCCVYNENIYTKPSTVDYNSIYSIEIQSEMTRDEIEAKRAESLKCDKAMFQRYRNLMEELETEK